MDRFATIEAFVQVAELGSFTAAAKRLRLSPSALSRRVGQLEDSVGVRLFHRTTRAVRLSEEGKTFFERARAALRDLDAAQEDTARLREKPAGLLRVEAPTIVGRHILAPSLNRFLAKHPEVQVELTLRDHPGDLASDGIDLSVRMGALEDSGLVARRLGKTRMRVCAAPAYLRRKGTPKTVAALGRHERLGYSVHGRPMPWRLRDGRVIREVASSGRIAVNNAEALIEIAISGAGLVWICGFMGAEARRAGALVEVLQDAACEVSPVHAVSLPSRHVLPKVRVFSDFVANELARGELD